MIWGWILKGDSNWGENVTFVKIKLIFTLITSSDWMSEAVLLTKRSGVLVLLDLSRMTGMSRYQQDASGRGFVLRSAGRCRRDDGFSSQETGWFCSVQVTWLKVGEWLLSSKCVTKNFKLPSWPGDKTDQFQNKSIKNQSIVNPWN